MMNNGLTSYRFFAFFAVFLYHFGLIGIGYMGVHAFFVLSGFLLTPILLDMKENLPTRKYYINFYGRRALRIFPLYFSYLIIISVAAYILINQFNYDPEEGLSRALNQMPYAATYTYNFFIMSDSYQQTKVITHFWSLAVEEQFYLIWPLFLMLVSRNNVKQLLLFLIVLSPLIRYVAAWCALTWPGSFNAYELTAYTFTLSSFDAFAIGGFFAVYVKNVKWLVLTSLIGFTVGIGVVTEYLSTGGLDVTSMGFKDFMADSYKYIWAYTLFSVIFGCMLVRIKNKEFFPVVMENRALVYLGTISYGLYVYHWPIMYFVSNTVGALIWPVRLMLILILSIVVASLSYELLEKRFLAKKDVLFKHG